MKDEDLENLRESMNEVFEKANARGEIVWTKGMTEEQRIEWCERSSKDANVVPVYGENNTVVGYHVIPDLSDDEYENLLDKIHDL